VADLSLTALLDVQARDTEADQLRHRRATLPERATLADAESGIARVDAELAGLRPKRDETARHQQRLEDEIASLDAKVADIEKKLYSGTVSAPRELQALQDDIDSLKRHKSALEDEELEMMEEREPLDADVSRLDGERSRFEADAGTARTALAEAEAVVDVELERVAGERAKVVDGVPAALLQQYERLREKLGGVGVSRLVGNSCTGCHLTLPAQEVARMRREPPGRVETCEQCGRILVVE
jgi:predicted  nucleic acid-binding Zn-ribbon protein